VKKQIKLALALSLLVITLGVGAAIEWDEEYAEARYNNLETVQDDWDSETAVQEDLNNETEVEEDWDHGEAENTNDNWDSETATQDEEVEVEEDEWDTGVAERTEPEEEPDDYEDWDHEEVEQDVEVEEDPEPEEEPEEPEEVEVEEEEEEPEPQPQPERTYTLPAEEHEISLNLPETAEVGENFTIEGNITGDDVGEGENATIFLNEEEHENTTIENETFSTELAIDQVSEHEITVQALDEQVTETIEISSPIEFGEISAPQTVEAGEDFEICVEVDAEEDQEVSLMRNGSDIETVTGTGELCFETTAPDSGMYEYTITAEDLEESVEIEVLEPAPEEEPEPEEEDEEDEEDEGGLITGNFLYQGASNFINSILDIFR